MADFAGSASPEHGLTNDMTNRLYVSGWSVRPSTPQFSSWELMDGTKLSALNASSPMGVWGEGTITAPVTAYKGSYSVGLCDDFFEHVIVLPRSIDAGIILSDTDYTVDVFNAYRNASRTWSSYTNNAGAGLTMAGLPTRPPGVPWLSGYTLTLTVEADGPPVIDGTLDFAWDVGTFLIPITGQRVVILPIPPEVPLEEKLVFKTNVIPKRNGTEQRIALREVPRQAFVPRFQLHGHERRLFNSIVFDSHSRTLGFPMWHEPTNLTSAISPTDTVINVESTAYADYRANSLLIVWQDVENYEALEISSFTSTTITVKSPFQGSFAVGTSVMPIRAAFFGPTVEGQRETRNVTTLQGRLDVLDSSQDYSSTSAFSSYNSKVLLDGPNMMTGKKQTAITKELNIFDPEVGQFEVYSEWDVSRDTGGKVFLTTSRKTLWEARQLLHALRGRAISFYLPTFFDDVEPVSAITAGSTEVTIKNIGYDKHVRDRQPKDVLMLRKTDGTTVVRGVSSSTELSATQEKLTMDSSWGVNASLSEIDFICYVEKVRFDSDEITIKHLDSIGQAVVVAPVKAVLD